MSEILENVSIVEKMTNLERVSNLKNTVLIGPNQKTVFSYPATANPIAGSIIFNNICAPSLTTVMKRTLRVQCSAVVTVTAAAANACVDPNDWSPMPTEPMKGDDVDKYKNWLKPATFAS